MSLFPPAALRPAHLAALPLLMASLPAVAEPRKTNASVTAPAVATPTSDIIPLPLNPVLPAGQRLCTAKAAPGLGYTMLRLASGEKPAAADYVLVNYIGYLAATGTVFDQGIQAAFPVSGVIPGFSEGLQMLAKTGLARFCIPAAMGYGAEDSGKTPANSDLVFQVELVDYKTPAEVEAMRRGDAPQPSEAAAPPQ